MNLSIHPSRLLSAVSHLLPQSGSAQAHEGIGADAVQAVQPLSDIAIGQPCEVVSVSAPAASADWARRLAEIGFIPGERVRVMARSLPGGDPLAVRIGTSTFALRRAEAACVQVRAVGLID